MECKKCPFLPSMNSSLQTLVFGEYEKANPYGKYLSEVNLCENKRKELKARKLYFEWQVRPLLEKIDKMSGGAFEEFVAECYRRQGHKVTMTPTTDDKGVDLIVDKGNTLRSVLRGRFVVQVKRQNTNVGCKAVEQVLMGMRVYDCQGVIVANRKFTRQAQERVKLLRRRKDSIRLVDRSTLHSWLLMHFTPPKGEESDSVGIETPPFSKRRIREAVEKELCQYHPKLKITAVRVLEIEYFVCSDGDFRVTGWAEVASPEHSGKWPFFAAIRAGEQQLFMAGLMDFPGCGVITPGKEGAYFRSTKKRRQHKGVVNE